MIAPGTRFWRNLKPDCRHCYRGVCVDGQKKSLEYAVELWKPSTNALMLIRAHGLHHNVAAYSRASLWLSMHAPQQQCLQFGVADVQATRHSIPPQRTPHNRASRVGGRQPERPHSMTTSGANMPICLQAVLMVDRMISPFTLSAGPILFCLAIVYLSDFVSWSDYVVTVCIYFLWILVSRTVRMTPHFWRVPGAPRCCRSATVLCACGHSVCWCCLRNV